LLTVEPINKVISGYVLVAPDCRVKFLCYYWSEKV